MSKPDNLGGIIHTYQKYDPVQFPSPTAPPPDLVSPAFEHLLLLRQHAPAHRGGTGPRRAHRSQPDSRTGAEPGIAHGPAARTQTQDSGDLRDRQSAERGASQLPRSGRGRRSRRPSCAAPSRRPCARSNCTTSNSCGIAPAMRTARSPGNCCTWPRRSARNIRSTNWRRSTISPAARP